MFRRPIKVMKKGRPADVLAMFCDIRGFTQLALDPEPAAALASHLYRQVGIVSPLSLAGARNVLFKPAGDGLLVIWELSSDPQSRIHAVRTIVDAMVRLNAEFTIPRGTVVNRNLSNRLGIGAALGTATCVALCEDQGDSMSQPEVPVEDYFGNVVNLAAKLQNFARPSGVCLDRRSFEGALPVEEFLALGFHPVSRTIPGVGPCDVLAILPRSEGRPESAGPAAAIQDHLAAWQVNEVFALSEGYVLTVPEDALGAPPSDDGLVVDDERVDRIMKVIADPNSQRVLLRADIETNSSYKQVIPYPIFRCRGRLHVFRRSEKTVDDRLEALVSIGHGGHVAALGPIAFQRSFRSLDRGTRDVFCDKVALESGTYQWRRVAILWDENALPEKAHIGIVYLCDVSEEARLHVVGPIQDAGWAAINDLENVRLDRWSQLCVRGDLLSMTIQ